MAELRYQLDLLKAMNQKLNEKEQMYRLICDTSDAAFLYCSFAKGEFMTLGNWNNFFDFDVANSRDFSNLPDIVDEAYSIKLRELLFLEKSGQAQSSMECVHRNKKIWLQFDVCVEYEDEQPVNKLIVIRDITEQKNQKDELQYMAYYDAMTGLYNRNYFVSLLEGYVEKAKENKAIVSLLMVDIDDFIKVKDRMGISFGDEIIQLLGNFLKSFSDNNVIVGRMDNDIFCIAVYDPIKNVNDVGHIIHTIQERMKKPFYPTNGNALNITVSMGVAEFPETAYSALQLINYAEIAIFKGRGKKYSNVSYFNTPLLSEFLNTVELENKLIDAVHENDFILYFQPQYYSGTKMLRGMEALIRWRDKDGSLINPGIFIPLAEKSGTIIDIGQWVVHESIKTYANWRDRFGIRFVLSINISSLQYKEENFVKDLIATTDEFNVDPSDIELEITESVLIDDFSEVIEKLLVLRDYGFRVSLDDFGTGFSSLSYLKKLPISTLKIDKSFVDTIMNDSSTRVITEAIINMVKALGFESIAEGVEEEQQREYLHAIGCDMIQGYLLGKPLPPKEIEELLKQM